MADLKPIDARARAELAKPDQAPNPLLMIPAEWLDQFMTLWGCNRTHFPSPMELCVRLRQYAKRGLTAAEFRAIVDRLTQPERQVRHRFPADVLTDLAGLTAKAIRARIAREEAAARRKPAPPAAPRSLVRRLADIFRAE